MFPAPSEDQVAEIAARAHLYGDVDSGFAEAISPGIKGLLLL